MDTLLKLSPAQSLLLHTAARRADGRVTPPDTLRGGARVNVLTALLQRGWIEPADGGHVMTDAGCAAIGQQRPAPQDDFRSVGTIGDLQLLEGIPVAALGFLNPIIAAAAMALSSLSVIVNSALLKRAKLKAEPAS